MQEAQSLQNANASENSARSIYVIDEEVSGVEWRGSGPADSHNGAFSITGQQIEVVQDKIKEASFIIPIASIRNFDLPDHLKPVLLEHLKSPDFFNMLDYPEASFTFNKMLPLTKPGEGAVAGANAMIEGDFTLLGITLPVLFPAKVEVIGEQLTVEAKLKIDRTRWGMNYAADPALGEHHIYPHVDLHLKLSARKQ
ncbi:hypothetical protein D770_02150 [Flammeovirgaceae bacterium 311]|nr:hypothetical protein D770_02150 [Flammeovirgaceae bacterium 311]